MKMKIYQKLWDAAKTVLKRKHIAITGYIKKQERSQIINLTLQLKELGKRNKLNTKLPDGRQKIKIRAEIKEIENRNTIEKIISPPILVSLERLTKMTKL